jgi:tetratricopeptide (TPR) repeat protein
MRVERVLLYHRLADLLEVQARFDDAWHSLHSASSALSTALPHLDPDTCLALQLHTAARLGTLACRRAQYPQAEQVYHQALQLVADAGLRQQPVWIKLTNDLAIVYKYWGKYAAAARRYQQVLAVLLARYGERHLDVATVYHNLAGLKHAQRQYAAAEPLACQSYRLHVTLLGAEHPRTVADGAAFGAILHGLKRWDEAIPLFTKAIDYFTRQFGPYHYEVAVNLNNLAAALHAQGHWQAAAPMYRRALDIKVTLLGANHPDVAMSLNNLGVLLNRHGEVQEARHCLAQALAIFTTTLGADHPQTRLCQENAAMA